MSSTPSSASPHPVGQPLATRSLAGAAPSRRVIDAPTRVFHWLFALSFLGAYLTAEGERWRMLHVTLGYVMAGLLVFRVIYGLVGPRQVRLSALWGKVSGASDWLCSLGRARALAGINWRQGQHIFMALAVVLLLGAVIPVTLTGYASFNEWGPEELGEWHAIVGDAFLWLVLAHLGGLLGLSVWRRKNLTTPMFTGRTEGRGPDLAKRNHIALAMLLLLAVAVYIAWEWAQSPKGLIALTTKIEHKQLPKA